MGRSVHYGQSRVDSCPYCGAQATGENEFGVPTCRHHIKMDMPPLKCYCGDWLDVLKGKWGPFFSCLNCGNMSWSKGLGANPGAFSKVLEKATQDAAKGLEKKQFSFKPNYEKKEITIRSDDPDYF